MFALISFRFWSWEMRYFRKWGSGEKEAHCHQQSFALSTTWFLSCFSTCVCFLGTLGATGWRWETSEPQINWNTNQQGFSSQRSNYPNKQEGEPRGLYPIGAFQRNQPSTLGDLGSLVQDNQNDDGRGSQVHRRYSGGGWGIGSRKKRYMILLRYYTDILTRQTNAKHTGPGWG